MDSQVISNSAGKNKKFAKWTGKPNVFDLLDKVGDRLTLVMDYPRSRGGIVNSMNTYCRKTNKKIRVSYMSSMMVEVEFVGMV